MVQLAPRRFTIPEYHRMGEIGVLPMESHQVELLDGEIYLRWSDDDRPAGSKRLFNVEEYDELVSAGILSEDERVELLEGEIVEMAPIGSRHSGTVIRLGALLSRLLGSTALLSIQSPLRLGDLSQPEPDLCVLRPRDDFYTSAHAQPQDVHLLVEVADTSIVSDHQVKLPLYAAGGVIEVWIVDLTHNAIEVYRAPSDSGYADTSVARRGETIAPSAFPDLTIAVSDILG